MHTGCSSGIEKKTETRQREWLYNTVNIPNTPELYSLKWLIVCYVNFTSI